MKILGNYWFNPGADMKVIGVIKISNEIGEIKYYIGTVEGNDLKEDIQKIVDYGAKFPKELGDKLF